MGIQEEIIKRKRKILEDSAFYGCSERDFSFVNTKEYEDLAIEMIKNKAPYDSQIELPYQSNEEIQENANKVFLQQIGDIDQQVLYLENYKPKDLHYNNPAEMLEYFNYLMQDVKKINVTDLPVVWKKDGQMGGGARSLLIGDVNHLNILNISPILSLGIILQNTNDAFGSTVLVHEMTHALVNRNKGIIKNYYNREVLSIYMELVTALELDQTGELLNHELLLRLKNLKKDMLDISCDIYYGVILKQLHVHSSFYAFSLFDKYQKGSNEVREKMRKEINETFLGNRTLEETLYVLGATKEQGSRVIQDYVKKIMK